MIEGISSSSISFSGCLGCSVHSDSQKSKKENTNTPIQNNLSKEKDTDATGLRLTPEQKKEVEELKKRDQEVRTHEQAHMTAGGDLASPASYTTTKGPDNKSYATGGEVQINVSPEEGNPEKTIEKARKIRSAALAPANPSSQDMQVASQANQMEAQARIEKNSIENAENGKNKLSEKNTITTKKQEKKSINKIENFSVNESLTGFLASPFMFSSAKNTTIDGNIIGAHLPPSQKAVASLYSYNDKLAQETSSSSLSLML